MDAVTQMGTIESLVYNFDTMRFGGTTDAHMLVKSAEPAEQHRLRKKERFAALLHHVTIDRLRESFLALKRNAAPGVDGVTWRYYEAGLEEHLQRL